MTSSPAQGARRLWSVRTQIAVLGAATALLVGLVLAGDTWILRLARDRFEREDTRATENRARIALAQSIDVDRHRITETAWWDELYDWAGVTHHGLPDRFVRENFIGWLPAQYGDRYIGIWGADGTPVFEWNDPNTPTLVGGLPTSAIFTLLDQQHSASGLLTHGGRIFQMAGALILPNTGERSGHVPRGYVLAIRPVNDTVAARLGASLQQQVDLRPVIQAPDSTVRLIYAGRDSAATSFGVTDIFGRKHVLMEVRTSRQFLSDSERWMRRSIQLALVIGALCLGLLAFVASRFLLRPFARIGAEFALMHAEGRFGRLQAAPTAREWALFLDNFNLLADDRERAERDLASARDDALASTRAKSEFLANMSHEIRTPMNAILGLSDLLRRTALGPEQQRYVEAVHGSGEALLTLVNDILDLSKVEAGKLTIETLPFDLHRAVAETVAIFTHRAAERGVELREIIAPEVPRQVLGDPGRVRQVLTNLVGNALKFTRQGRVLVRLTAEERGEESTIRFAVEDTGIGIPPDKLDRIFEKFAQADSSTTRKFGGTGLGLAISRQLVELMGGTLSVQSEVGRGSTFGFALPLPACVGVPAPLPRDLPLSGLRLLHCSTDGVPDPGIAAALAAVGLHVTEAPAFLAPDECLLAAAADGAPYHFIVVEGEQMSAAMQQVISTCGRAPCPTVGIVALVRRGFRGSASHARVAGAHAFLVQPVPPTDLRETLAVARQIAVGGLTWPLITRQWLVEARAADEDGTVLAVDQRVPAPGTRVLVTDDNELNRLIAGEYLRRLGAEVEMAASGREALVRLAQGGIDLVFMDCQMPELDGYETTGRIRELAGPTREVPVVAMTANAMQGDRERCLAAGMNDYVSKPIREADIARVLRRWGEGGPHRDAPQEVPRPSLAEPAQGASSAPRLDGLISSGPGGAGLAGRLMARFLRETPAQVEALRQAIVRREWGTAARVAHALRGTAGVMGASGVAELCGRIETAASREAQKDALDGLEALEAEVQRTLGALGADPPDAPALDPVKLEEYRRLDQECPGLSQSLFQLFLRDAPGRITAMEAALAAEDATGVREAAHAMKGAALQLGVLPLGRLAGVIEEETKRGDLTSARARFPLAIEEWERARRAITDMLEGADAQPSGVD